MKKWFTALAVFFGMISIPAFSGTVTKVVKKKGIVIIDEGSASQIAKGSKICFFDGPKKVTCGKARKVTADKTYVKVSKKRIKKLKKGMTATPADDGGAVAGVDAIELTGAWAVSILTPSTYQKLAFDPADGTDQSGPSSAWLPSGDMEGLSMAGFLGELAFPMAGIKFGLGIRFRSRSFESISNYNSSALSQFLTITQTESAMGIMLNAYFMHVPLGAMTFILGGGLDIDQSTLKLEMIQKDDGDASIENTVYSGTSAITTVSLSFIPKLTFPLFGPMQGFAALQMLIPVSGAATASGDAIQDEQVIGATSADLNIDPNEDLATSLGHKNNGFGLAFWLGGTLLI